MKNDQQMRDVKRREGEGREGGENVIEDYTKNIRTYATNLNLMIV